MIFRRLVRYSSNSRQLFICKTRLSNHLAATKDGSCQYPPIIDMSEEGQKRHFRQLWYNSVKALPTVEEKLHELAVQQRIKLPIYSLSAVPSVYNATNFCNYITRTHVIDNLPKQITSMNVSKELEDVRETFYETLLNFYYNEWEENRNKRLQQYLLESDAGCKLVNAFIMQCYKKLSSKNDYILQSTIQQKPRILSFWWHSGFESEEDKIHEKNLCFQYEDYASMCIRVRQPLSPILSPNDPMCSTAEVIDYNFHPDVFKIPAKTHSVASVPGFWPGDPCEFPFLQILGRDKLKSLCSNIRYYDPKKIDDAVGVISSFAWLNASTTYQGFTPFHDITYPFVAQTILTNGQDWNFFVYQLNTVALHSDVDEKRGRNICWSSGRLRLFDTIENGQVKGVDETVFETLLKFLHHAPQRNQEINLKPYLGPDTRTTDEIVHFRYFLRRMYSRAPNRMDHRDEVPTWVKIYKLHPDAPPSPFVKLE